MCSPFRAPPGASGGGRRVLRQLVIVPGRQRRPPFPRVVLKHRSMIDWWHILFRSRKRPFAASCQGASCNNKFPLLLIQTTLCPVERRRSKRDPPCPADALIRACWLVRAPGFEPGAAFFSRLPLAVLQPITPAYGGRCRARLPVFPDRQRERMNAAAGERQNPAANRPSRI